jgi:hypothetical protein
MAQKKEKARKPCFDYPEDTAGTRAAAEARARTNNLPKEEIEKLYQMAIRIADGGEAKPKAGGGHKHSS